MKARRKGTKITGWIVPSAILVLLPKCPVCVAMYVALFTGIGISVASAAKIRMGVLMLCVGALGWLAWRSVGRVAFRRCRSRAR